MGTGDKHVVRYSQPQIRLLAMSVQHLDVSETIIKNMFVMGNPTNSSKMSELFLIGLFFFGIHFYLHFHIFC